MDVYVFSSVLTLSYENIKFQILHYFPVYQSNDLTLFNKTKEVCDNQDNWESLVHLLIVHSSTLYWRYEYYSTYEKLDTDLKVQFIKHKTRKKTF